MFQVVDLPVFEILPLPFWPIIIIPNSLAISGYSFAFDCRLLSHTLAYEERTLAARTGMRGTKILMELEALAEKLGIEVIHEKLSHSRSGLCRLHDQYMVFIERNLDENEQVEVLVTALSRFPLDDIQVLPGIRHLLAEYQMNNLANTDLA